MVFAFPHKDSLNNLKNIIGNIHRSYHVRTDSLKGIRTLSVRELPFIFSPATFARAEMHLPRVESALLIFAPSFRRAPVAPVAFALSEPARSTKHNLHNRTALSKDYQESNALTFCHWRGFSGIEWWWWKQSANEMIHCSYLLTLSFVARVPFPTNLQRPCSFQRRKC